MTGQFANPALAAPRLEFVMEIRVDVGAPVEIASTPEGMRRFVPIVGGTFYGPRISGVVMPGGADWQTVEPDGGAILDATYALETCDGERMEVRNLGLRNGAPDVMARLAAGEQVRPDSYYFRTSPRFFPEPGALDWLRKSIFLASGERQPSLVVLDVWRIG